jgi:O-antigen/teichoic acid export membrane protein
MSANSSKWIDSSFTALSVALANSSGGSVLESPTVLQTIRNIAIIAALAAGVDFLPGGGAAAATVLSALTMIFFAAIAWLIYRVYREQQLTLSTLTDGRKAGLFGAVGGIALLVVGYDDFSSWTGGVLLWVALMAACVAVIFLVWRGATTYS